MKVYLFPHYVSLSSSAAYSPRLFTLLRQKDVPLQQVGWDGKLESLPTNERVIVRGSTRLEYGNKALAQTCQRLGHFVFYDDTLLLPNGEQNYEKLIPAAEQFLAETMAIT